MNKNILYSEIDIEKVKNYKHNFLDTEKTLKWFFESIFYIIVRIILFLPLIYFVIVNFSIVNENFFYMIYQKIYEFLPTFNRLSEENIIKASSLTTIIFLVMAYIYLILIEFLMTKLFKKHTDYKNRNKAFKFLENDIKEILEFEELLKKQNITKMWMEHKILYIEYIGINGITSKCKLNLKNYFEETIKEDCIDFTWLDDMIQLKLETLKLKQILEFSDDSNIKKDS